ncbi:MAG: phenylalanine--tRNA ligase subunit alpha [Ignavibacteria bacterium]|nr:phenylalanine--tRNA ligase subunit alpha [Ignavibacteria bacterium]
MNYLELIQKTAENARNDLGEICTPQSAEDFRIKYLGRKGKISDLFEKISAVPKEIKSQFGRELNSLKKELEARYEDIIEKFPKSKSTVLGEDLTLPGLKPNIGSKHIVTQTLNEIKEIFKNFGFITAEGPEVESDYYNFSALNFPEDHPARDMQDTFFVSKDLLLRTHTSPVQIRYMEKHPPPIRIIAPGRVFRNEAVSARSHCIFHQVEGLYVDRKVTFAELKGTLFNFAKLFYGSDVSIRFRPSFFPFTEPSAEMDVSCVLCRGKGCRVCKYSGWLEILGCGMVDPNVFKSVDYDPEEFTGYAFGIGIERIAMLKYGIDDIRILFDNDIRFLKQFTRI